MDIEKVLGENGLLEQQMPQFTARASQLTLAQTISDVIAENKTLIAEAGTGTGKTFAYLVPALLSGKKTIISTGTKNLQDQLFKKDLPFLLAKLRQEININPKVKLLKGRSNYLCLYRYHHALHKAVARFPGNQALFAALPRWIESTDSGDLVDLSDLMTNPIVRRDITSTVENCLGKDCDYYNDCFVYKARNQAQNADILVINHHLLLADMALKEEGFGELLPAAKVIVIDESHQLSGIAERFFSTGISSRQCKDLLADIKTATGDIQAGFATIQDTFFDFEISLKRTMAAMAELNNRQSIEELLGNEDIHNELTLLQQNMADLNHAIEPLAVADKGMEQCYLRLSAITDLTTELLQHQDSDHVYWYEAGSDRFALHKSPL